MQRDFCMALHAGGLRANLQGTKCRYNWTIATLSSKSPQTHFGVLQHSQHRDADSADAEVITAQMSICSAKRQENVCKQLFAKRARLSSSHRNIHMCMEDLPAKGRQLLAKRATQCSRPRLLTLKHACIWETCLQRCPRQVSWAPGSHGWPWSPPTPAAGQ